MTVLAVALGVALVGLTIGAVVLVVSGTLSGGAPAAHAASLTLDSGQVVWSDTAPSSGDGWFTGTDSAGVLYHYSGGSYEIDAGSLAGNTDAHASSAPYSTGLAAMAISASVTVTVQGSEDGAGVRCEHAGRNGTTHYVAFLFPGGTLNLERYAGSSNGTSDFPTTILSTSFADAAGPGQANQLDLACITESASGGTVTTRLLVQVDGGTPVSTTDAFATGGSSAWYGGVESEADSVVDFSDLSIRNLEG
jgi:hypothetical protein